MFHDVGTLNTVQILRETFSLSVVLGIHSFAVIRQRTEIRSCRRFVETPAIAHEWKNDDPTRFT